jgi:hypothetical protein
MESVWLESDFDGMIVGDAGHKLWMRDIFFKVAHITVPQGISVNNSAEVRGTRVYIDITSGPGPAGVSLNDTCLVQLFDSSIWIDPAASFPTTINVGSTTAKMRLSKVEFDRSLVRGSTQQIADEFRHYALAYLRVPLLMYSAVKLNLRSPRARQTTTPLTGDSS